MTHPLQDLIHRLRSMPPAPGPELFEDLGEWISSAPITAGELRDLLDFQPQCYTRTLLFRSELREVLLLCWSPGQVSSVHDHDGQRGWVRVLSGSIEETLYARQVGPDGALAPVCCQLFDASPAVVTVDETRAIHRLRNASSPESGGRAVTLHVYSRPVESCGVYDVNSGETQRLELSYDNRRDSSWGEPRVLGS